MKKNRVFWSVFFILSAFIFIMKENIFQIEICQAKTVVSKKIYINYNKLYLLEGEHKTLKLINTKKPVIWNSSNSSVAVINKKGVVTALSNGKAILTGTSGKNKYTSIVTVKSPTLNTNNITLTIDECTQLKINDTSITPIWKTDNINVANVSPSGQVVAISPGNAKITAIIGSLNLTCNITVTSPAINIPKNTIRAGDFYQLEITGIKTSVQWKSMDPSIAVVSEEGIVIGVSNGNTTIIGTAGSYQFGCIVSVESYSLNRTSILLNVGQSTLLQILGSSEPVIWLSTDTKIASVDSSGLVSAVSPGKVNISGIVGDKTYICTVTVDGLTLNYTAVQLSIDDSIQLVVSGTTAPVEWQSSNEDIADVEDGLVYAYAEGSTEISAIIGNRKLSCIITVTP